MRPITVVLGAVLLAGDVAGSGAQVLSGRVTELGSDRPIVAAAISVHSGGQSMLSIQSDSTGFFRMVLPQPGWYRVRVDRLGYAPAESDTLEIGRGELVEVGIRLRVAAVQLTPLMVVERRSMAPSPEFYRRLDAGRRSGSGFFITREELDSTKAISLTSLLSRVPQVGMAWDRNGKARPVMLSQGGCPATLYLTGAPLNLTGGEALDDLIDPITLDGVEIYRNRAELPFEVAGPRECGAILLWTRPGERTRGGVWRIVVGAAALVGMVALYKAM